MKQNKLNSMRRATMLLAGVSLYCAPSLGLADANAEPPVHRPAKPNVVLILVDDLGWQDVKCYDIDEPSPMETPNIDALATKGVMFWQGYSPAPVCAPSRAAILSGLHPARGEMTSVAGGFPPHPGNPGAAEISPFYTARMPVERFTLAEALKAEGYVTGHSGKWHISKNHYDYPKPFRHGFDVSVHKRGVQANMKPDRLTGFATNDPQDPYRLDENGFPFDEPQEGAMTFIKENQDKPFFLYYATWLVHGPWVMRSEALLRKYEQKLGVKITEEHKDGWDILGQKNPFYCAMVEQLDYYLGQIFTYLEATDDPRWPGHTLSENTYVIFTSDNGGMEMNHTVTDNYPLDRGKISAREGGTRVPLIITGPDIPKGVQTDVMANGLDFYPTLLSLVGAKKPAGKVFDGCDLAPLLTGDPSDPSLVRHVDGTVRDTMVWHFPHSENTSSIRVDDFKLLRTYRNASSTKSLYRLYTSEGDKPVRADIEEMKDLAQEMPEKAAELDTRLGAILDEMGGRLPYGNPNSSQDLPNKEQAPTILGHKQAGNTVEVNFRNNGAGIAHADLIYTPNDGREWLRSSGRVAGEDKVVYTLPVGTSHYFINLVDENNFLVIYPPIDRPKMKKENLDFSDVAIFAGYPEPTLGEPVDLGKLYAQRSAAEGSRTVLLANDFEEHGLKTLQSSGEGVSITETVAGSGKRCLRLFEAESLEREWMPMASADIASPAEISSGVFRVSLDVMLEKDAPGVLSLALKDQKSGVGVVIGHGAIKASDRTVMGLEPGAWVHLDISGRFGNGSDKMLTVSVTTVDGRSCVGRVPYADIHFDRPTTIQMIGLGPVGGGAYVDNLMIAVEE